MQRRSLSAFIDRFRGSLARADAATTLTAFVERAISGRWDNTLQRKIQKLAAHRCLWRYPMRDVFNAIREESAAALGKLLFELADDETLTPASHEFVNDMREVLARHMDRKTSPSKDVEWSLPAFR